MHMLKKYKLVFSLFTGESYISVDELLAVFNNESAIDLLCQKVSYGKFKHNILFTIYIYCLKFKQ